MKSAQTIYNVFIGIALLVIIVFQIKLYQGSPVKKSDQKSGFLAAVAADTNHHGPISVFVNTDTLNANYLYLQDMLDELAAEKLKYESSMNAQIKKLEEEVMEFQENARFMTQTQGEARQMELAQKEQDLMKLQQDLNNKLIESEADRNKLIQSELSAFLKEYNSAGKFSYVFGFNGSGNLLFADSTLDVTREILAGLNARYESKKKTASK